MSQVLCLVNSWFTLSFRWSISVCILLRKSYYFSNYTFEHVFLSPSHFIIVWLRIQFQIEIFLERWGFALLFSSLLGAVEKSKVILLHIFWNHFFFSLDIWVIFLLLSFHCSEISQWYATVWVCFRLLCWSLKGPFQTRDSCLSLLGNFLGLFPDYFFPTVFSFPLDFIFWMINVLGLIWYSHFFPLLYFIFLSFCSTLSKIKVILL